MTELEPKSDETTLPQELMPYLGFVLGKVSKAWLGRVNPGLEQLGVEIHQVGLMALIYFRGPQSQVELGRLMRIDRTTIVGLIDGIEAAGLVERQPNPQDRRAHRVTLTEKGKQVLETSEPIVNQVQRDFLSPLSTTEQETLMALLRRLI